MKAPAEPKYLDRTCAELIESAYDIHFFCSCSRHVTLGPEDFARWPDSTLHRIAARLKCNGCGARGDIPDVRLTSTRARGGGMSGAHTLKAARHA